MTRQDFLERRQHGIGGSDIAAIAGLSTWRSPLDVYIDKTAPIKFEEIEPSLPIGKNAALYWGRVLEPEVGKAYTLCTGRKVQRYTRLLVHPTIPYFIGDVDFLAFCDNGKRPAKPKGEIVTNRGVECKTARYAWDEWGTVGTDEVPPYYLCQVQWYMGLCAKLEVFDIPLLSGTNDFRIYTVERNDEIISCLQEIGKDFWGNYILPKLPPSPRTLEEVKKLNPQANGKTIIASSEVETLCRKLAETSTLRLQLEADESKLKDEIAIAMGENEVLTLPDETVLATFKNEKKGRVLRLKKQK